VAKGKAKAYRRYQELLSAKNIDIVIIATPEHWHAQMVLDALAAGKDVYVEKPLCHKPEQGVELMQAARKSKQIVQVGMQRRSYPLYLKARDIRAAGTLGNVRLVRTWWVNNSLTRKPDEKLTVHWIGNSGRDRRGAARWNLTAFAIGATTKTTPAASWRTRERTSTTAFI
jgi:predicted dehydrogenase